MNPDQTRFHEDWQKLHELSQRSGFWTVTEPVKKPAGGWEMLATIDGRCLASPGVETQEANFCDQQRIRLVIAADYPRSPPRITIESPVFHPNIAADGIVSLDDIDLTWNPENSLDRVLEGIWETLRGNRVDANNAIHVGAGQWYAQHTGKGRLRLPLDERPLIEATKPTNIVRYRKLGEPFREYRPAEPIVIDDSSAAQEVASERPPANSPIHFID